MSTGWETTDKIVTKHHGRVMIKDRLADEGEEHEAFIIDSSQKALHGQSLV